MVTSGRPPTIAVAGSATGPLADFAADVVDAFRRLYGSVSRFVLMLTDDQARFASVGTSGSHSLNQLLSILAEQAKAVAFVRLRELKAASGGELSIGGPGVAALALEWGEVDEVARYLVPHTTGGGTPWWPADWELACAPREE